MDTKRSDTAINKPASAAHRRAVWHMDAYPSLIGVNYGRYCCSRHAKRGQVGSAIYSKLFIVWCHYCAAKFIVCCYLKYKHDRLLAKWRPQEGDEGIQLYGGHRCVLPEPAKLGGQQVREELLQQIQRLASWLAVFGDPWPSISGSPVLSFGYFAATILLCPIANFYFAKLRPLRLDVLCFIRNPRAEQVRARHKLVRLATSLMDSVTDRPREKVPLEQAKQVVVGRRIEHLSFILLLRQVCSSEALRPSSLTLSSHTSFVEYYILSRKLSLIIVSSTNLIISSIIFLCELFYRAEHRINLYRCAHWNSNSSLVNLHQLHLPPLTSGAHESAYLELMPLRNISVWRRIYLGLFVEARYLFNLPNLMTLLDLGVCSLVVEVALFFNVMLFALGNLQQIIWLKQVQTQIKLTLAWLNQRLGDKQRPAGKLNLDLELTKASLTSYLSFSLFKRDSQRLQRLNSLLISQVTCMASILMLGCYCVSLNTNLRLMPLVAFFLSYMIILINFYLALASFLNHRARSIMRDISSVVAAHRTLLGLNQSDCNNKLMFDFWFRQMSTGRELDNFFASRILGATVSYDKLIVFDIYALYLYLFMLRDMF